MQRTCLGSVITTGYCDINVARVLHFFLIFFALNRFAVLLTEFAQALDWQQRSCDIVYAFVSNKARGYLWGQQSKQHKQTMLLQYTRGLMQQLSIQKIVAFHDQ